MLKFVFDAVLLCDRDQGEPVDLGHPLDFFQPSSPNVVSIGNEGVFSFALLIRMGIMNFQQIFSNVSEGDIPFARRTPSAPWPQPS